MTERILLISGDEDWRKALLIELQEALAEASETESSENWLRAARAFRPTAIVLHTENPGSVPYGSRRAEGQRMMSELYKAYPTVPLLLVKSVPDQQVSDFAGALDSVTKLYDQDGDPEKLAAGILASAACLRPPVEPPSPSEWGIIEVILGPAQIECHLQAGTRSETLGPYDWNRSDIKLVNEDFELYESKDEIFLAKVDDHLLATTGKRLLNSFEHPFGLAQAWFERYVKKGGTLYHRFTVTDGDLDFVPFELIATRNKGEYLRSVHPLARRLIVAQEHGDPDRNRVERLDSSIRVLFILANVNGALSLPNITFKTLEAISLEPLNHVEEELEKVINIYGVENVRLLRLEHGQDTRTLLAEVLSAEFYNVVHFAGHSLRADQSNDVFLVLPGGPLEVLAYNAEDFAKRAAAAGVQFVILSSCEGASCQALSRLASFGVPAVAGFRWKVDDYDAAAFTPALHQALRTKKDNRSIPLVEAFCEALHVVKENTQASLTWFSPILMLQPKVWHDFKIGV